MSTPPPPRSVIADLPAYVPGKPPVPRPGLTTYKLSSNENPYPPLPGIEQAVAAAAAAMNRYPDMGASVMYGALADRLGVTGTPTLVAADGRVLPGAASAEQINAWLSRSTTSAEGPAPGNPAAQATGKAP